METITLNTITNVNTIIDSTIATLNHNTILPTNLDNQPDNQDHNIEQEQIVL